MSSNEFQALHDQGYLLFEFRPLDDNFMEDRVTGIVEPRYKFEKPDLMDFDVAVSVEDAQAVLLCESSHKWSRVLVGDFAMAQVSSWVEEVIRETDGADTRDMVRVSEQRVDVGGLGAGNEGGADVAWSPACPSTSESWEMIDVDIPMKASEAYPIASV